MFFLLFLHDDRRIRIRIQSRIRIRIREAQKHVDPVDPDSDPQHCCFLYVPGGSVRCAVRSAPTWLCTWGAITPIRLCFGSVFTESGTGTYFAESGPVQTRIFYDRRKKKFRIEKFPCSKTVIYVSLNPYKGRLDSADMIILAFSLRVHCPAQWCTIIELCAPEARRKSKPKRKKRKLNRLIV
jgi:hypothetical protein